MTKEMSKHKKRTAREEERMRAEAQLQAYAAWVAKDNQILAANQVSRPSLFPLLTNGSWR